MAQCKRRFPKDSFKQRDQHILMREVCPLCGKVFPYRFLRRCCRCGRLYCRDCITFTEDGNSLCLNCARRIVSPRRLGTKYSPLSRYLTRRAPFTNRVTLTFAKIEGIIGDNLPFSASRYRHWWANTRDRTQAQAWLDVGWAVRAVDLSNRAVTFERVAGSRIKTGTKHREVTPASVKTPIRPAKPKTTRSPSKTRIARVQARLKNVKCGESSMRRHRGKFKPNSAHEKRLYRLEVKPEK